MADGKIFVRERRQITEGEKMPRFVVVGAAGTDLKIVSLFSQYFFLKFETIC